MTGNLVIKNGSPFSSIVLDNSQGQGIKLETRPNDDSFIGEISFLDVANGYSSLHTLLLPKKSGTLALESEVNTKAPLDEFNNVKNNYYDKFGMGERDYPAHYKGSHVWTIRFNQYGGLRIIQLRAEIQNNTGEIPIYLPESVSTRALAMVTDDGYARYSYGAKVTSESVVTVFAPKGRTVGFHLLVMDWVNF